MATVIRRTVKHFSRLPFIFCFSLPETLEKALVTHFNADYV